jgi:3',5'-cyclic-AMP phosphodiesterase
MTPKNPPEDSKSHLLVQISDTHLCADPERKLRGINTRECLQAVLELASDHLHEASHIMVSGDISHDESAQSYTFLQQQLASHEGVIRWLPGNHDDVASMRQAVSQSNWPILDDLGAWKLIGLNSQLSGKSAGYLDDDQLSALESALAENEHPFVLVALHHPPIPTGSQWMDEISLINQHEFRQLLNKYRQVAVVIFGHAHQEMDETHQGIRWLCCPSTCVQFQPDTATAYSDTRLPGYRWLRLHEDGSLQTGVERIAQWPPGNAPDRRQWS